MPHRDEALAILKRAREALLARLTEAIVDQEEELMADAEGDSFLSEIETLYERMGSKLAHLNQMIANLPPELADADSGDEAEEDEPFFREDAPAAEQHPRLPHFPFPISAATTRPVADERPIPRERHLSGERPVPQDWADVIGLPAPGVPTQKSPAFGRFVTYIELGQVNNAGDLIGQLLGLSPHVGQTCVQVFAARYEADPGVVIKAMRIRQELSHQRYNDALLLIHECFGLQGIDAMIALHRMKEFISTSTASGN